MYHGESMETARGSLPFGRKACINERMKLAGQILAVALAVAVLAGCDSKGAHKDGVYQGYLDGRFLGVASPQEGQLLELKIRRGDWVEAGAPLFALDPKPEVDELREDEQKVASAQAHVDDLRKGLRDTELAALDAQLQADQALLEQAKAEWERNQKLQSGDFVSANDLDRLKFLTQQYTAVTQRDANQLATGKLGSREDQIAQAAADLLAAEAVRDHTKWMLDQKTQTAPQAGWVHDTLFRTGERVGSGQAVVVLLPAEELRARFYVPEGEINRVKLGQEVTVKLDGIDPVKAKVSFISTEVEFTPPVIYSDSQNYKYVFLVEADFDPKVARELHVGQPAEVSLQP
jgi:HlyD family secretion protein